MLSWDNRIEELLQILRNPRSPASWRLEVCRVLLLKTHPNSGAHDTVATATESQLLSLVNDTRQLDTVRLAAVSLLGQDQLESLALLAVTEELETWLRCRAIDRLSAIEDVFPIPDAAIDGLRQCLASCPVSDVEQALRHLLRKITARADSNTTISHDITPSNRAGFKCPDPIPITVATSP
jgi:hypothetical protein